MTATAALLAFTLAAAILTITPGLDNALVLRTAAVEGSRRALMAGLGISAGCLLWGAIAAFGLGSLLAVSTLAYDTLRICAAIYLFYLGVKLLWSTRSRRKAATASPSGILATPAPASYTHLTLPPIPPLTRTTHPPCSPYKRWAS
uniref:LysE family translocator n=1 Tax=Achromobacter insolitus TaxID=217204 RepID=UPI001CD7D38D